MKVEIELNDNMVHAYQAARQKLESLEDGDGNKLTKEAEKKARATRNQSAKALLAAINEQLDEVI